MHFSANFFAFRMYVEWARCAFGNVLIYSTENEPYSFTGRFPCYSFPHPL